jgi:hypothetical protein
VRFDGLELIRSYISNPLKLTINLITLIKEFAFFPDALGVATESDKDNVNI